MTRVFISALKKQPFGLSVLNLYNSNTLLFSIFRLLKTIYFPVYARINHFISFFLSVSRQSTLQQGMHIQQVLLSLSNTFFVVL